MRKNPPLLRYSPFGKRVYIITRYTIRKNGSILANEKYDVTKDFEEVKYLYDMPGESCCEDIYQAERCLEHNHGPGKPICETVAILDGDSSDG